MLLVDQHITQQIQLGVGHNGIIPCPLGPIGRIVHMPRLRAPGEVCKQVKQDHMCMTCSSACKHAMFRRSYLHSSASGHTHIFKWSVSVGEVTQGR